jgi:hypothetical protein
MVANASVQGTSALPDKELILPNQNSWSETAAHMGINWLLKQKCLPEECRSIEWAIGMTNRCRCTHNDPYGTGECSGMQAKPEMLSCPPLQPCPLRADFCDLDKICMPPTTFPQSFFVFMSLSAI